jgi:glycerol-3-phosphate dehydrogenase
MADEIADYDLAIIGGGINGAGIARDAAGRGLRVLLLEQNDLASGTSSASSKLIHGGLRYLEHGAFRLVREALAEREVMLKIAPHVVRPMRFVLPAYPGPRSALLLRLGLFLYDHLGARKILPPTRTLDLTHHVTGLALKRGYRYGFEYSDCWVDDSRLVILNAVDAAERGAHVRTHTRCLRAEREDVWRLILDDRGRRDVATARVLVNAAGPWVGVVAETVIRQAGPARVRLVKGSHIVVKQRFEHDRGYILQTEDRRVIFALPYGNGFTLIGTTDLDFTGDPAMVTPSADEIAYLCRSVNVYFRENIAPGDVISAFAGVRSLYDDGAGKPEDITRDYHLEFDERLHQAPLLTVYGGKITTYRRLAEAALARLAHCFKATPAWTAQAPLPGGDFPYDGVEALVAQTQAKWPFMTEGHVCRLVRAYGTRVDRILGTATGPEDLGQNFGAGLTEAEVRYLMHDEWAQTEDDVLSRRTKLGLQVSALERQALAQFMAGAAARV